MSECDDLEPPDTWSSVLDRSCSPEKELDQVLDTDFELDEPAEEKAEQEMLSYPVSTAQYSVSGPIPETVQILEPYDAGLLGDVYTSFGIFEIEKETDFPVNLVGGPVEKAYARGGDFSEALLDTAQQLLEEDPWTSYLLAELAKKLRPFSIRASMLSIIGYTWA